MGEVPGSGKRTSLLWCGGNRQSFMESAMEVVNCLKTVVTIEQEKIGFKLEHFWEHISFLFFFSKRTSLMRTQNNV
jgi:hypothetical protein